MAKDIEERTFEFALQVVDLARSVQKNSATDVLVKQLVRSGTSIGANVEESRAGYTREDFRYKMSLALKEAREAHYWLRLLKESRLVKTSPGIEALLDEAEQIKKILGSIVSKSRGRTA